MSGWRVSGACRRLEQWPPHVKVIRATRDVDLLIDVAQADEIDVAMKRLGFVCLHRSADAANHLRNDERVVFLYATRPIAHKYLATAIDRNTAFGEFRVISPKGRIGFELQGFVNKPRCTQDLEDIRALLRANVSSLNLRQVRGYFRLFDKERLLDDILVEIT